MYIYIPRMYLVDTILFKQSESISFEIVLVDSCKVPVSVDSCGRHANNVREVILEWQECYM
jgi:hypothetical protein